MLAVHLSASEKIDTRMYIYFTLKAIITYVHHNSHFTKLTDSDYVYNL